MTAPNRDLLPCPFCGSKAALHPGDGICCSNQDCAMFHISLDEEFWNRRAALPAEGWISVESALPEDTLFVLVYMPQSECSHTAFRLGDEWFGTWGDKRMHKTTRISHWRPLPSPPGGRVG